MDAYQVMATKIDTEDKIAGLVSDLVSARVERWKRQQSIQPILG